VICSSRDWKFDASLARLSIIAGYLTVKETTLILVTSTFFLLIFIENKKVR
jgi:hypothetical protein